MSDDPRHEVLLRLARRVTADPSAPALDGWYRSVGIELPIDVDLDAPHVDLSADDAAGVSADAGRS